MTIEKTERIKRFMNDVATSEAVYEAILETFLKRKDRADIHLLAAARIAIDLLEESWRDLSKYKNESKKEAMQVAQVGL